MKDRPINFLMPNNNKSRHHKVPKQLYIGWELAAENVKKLVNVRFLSIMSHFQSCSIKISCLCDDWLSIEILTPFRMKVEGRGEGCGGPKKLLYFRA